MTANSIITPQTPNTATVALGATAQTTLTAPTNVTQLMQAGTLGARLTRLEFLATATQAATQVQVYRSIDAGTTKVLVRAVAFPAYTLATTTTSPILDLGYADDNPLVLKALEILYVGSAVAVTGINARAEWGDY